MLHQQACKDMREVALEMSAAGKPLGHAETTRFVLRESELSAHLSFLYNTPSAPCGRDKKLFLGFCGVFFIITPPQNPTAVN